MNLDKIKNLKPGDKHWDNELKAELTFMGITKGGLLEYEYFDENKQIVRSHYEVMTEEILNAGLEDSELYNKLVKEALTELGVNYE